MMRSSKSRVARRPVSTTLIEPLERRQLMAADTGASSAMLLSSDASATMSATASVVAAQRVYLTGNSMTDAVWYGGLTAGTLLSRVQFSMLLVQV